MYQPFGPGFRKNRYHEACLRFVMTKHIWVTIIYENINSRSAPVEYGNLRHSNQITQFLPDMADV